jgi:histidinol dehydrogenase
VLALRDRLRSGTLTAAGAFTAEQAQRGLDVAKAVSEIIADVQARGDQAVIDWTARLHGLELTSQTLAVPAAELQAAHAQADKAFLRLVRRVIKNIRAYQRRIMVKAPAPLKAGGRELSVRYTPMRRVAIYVPGAKAAYPSTVLMTVVPAQVAGVGQIVMATPPGPEGRPNAMVLALAAELGIEVVYCAAGVACLAGLAMGTPALAQVDKIAGPGNAFIAEAKRQLLGRVGIDSIAGPSEVFIVADETARADWLAADMLAQAEHNPGSAILATPSARLAAEVVAAIERQLPQLERAEAIELALKDYSAIIVTADLEAACRLADEFAPEHLQIITADDQAAMARINNAGAIFLGPYSPVPLGDYYAGPSHVLPTGSTARFFGPLSCNDFLKASSVVRYDAASLAAAAADVADFATREGLTAHARSITVRTVTKRENQGLHE